MSHSSCTSLMIHREFCKHACIFIYAEILINLDIGGIRAKGHEIFLQGEKKDDQN